ncbi:MAG: glycosyltransferase family 1 protein [bacterium]|nr:glycosyltransferase family 1 protein [bacterium]
MRVIGIDASRANIKKRTGTEWYIFNLLNQLKDIIPQDNYKVILYTKEPLLEDLLPLPKNWENVVLRWSPKLMWTQIRMSIAMLRFWSRPDILFIPAHTIPIIHPKRSVYVAHDLGFENSPELYANSYIGGSIVNFIVRVFTFGKYSTSELDYHRWSMNFAAKHASKIITISEFTKSELKSRYQIEDSKILVVHNGFSSHEYHPVPDTNNQKQYILYIGRLEHKKNIVNLIKAFNILRNKYKLNHQLYLVGSPGNGYENIKSEILKHNLHDVVQELGYVEQDKMNVLMNDASLFIFPTNYEGFGIPILEALATGTTVVCSDIPPLKEVCEDACIYFNHHDPESIAAKMNSAINLSEIDRKQLSDVGFERVKFFSWQKCADKTWKALKSELDAEN